MNGRFRFDSLRGLCGLLVLLPLLAVSTALAEPVELVQTVKDDEDGVDGIGGVRAVAISPDGNHVYATGEGDNAVAVFSRDGQGNGRLTFVEQEIDGIDGVDGIEGADAAVVSPDGAHVYVCGAFESGLAAFARTPATGELDFLEALFDGVDGVTGIASPVAIAISPDGAHVYVSGFSANAVAVFSRDAVTGLLTFVEAQVDDMGGVDGLAGAFGLEVSPDGSHLYVSSFGESMVSVFSRNAVTGALTFVEAKSGDPGLFMIRDLAVSADGAQVYTAGFSGSELGVFGRDETTGELTFIEAKKQGEDGVTGLTRPASVAISPNGEEVYAIDAAANALAVFDRNAADGTLDFVEAEFNNLGGGDGLLTPLWVAVSPDSDNVYTAAFMSSAVTGFYVGIFADGFESGDTSAWTTTQE